MLLWHININVMHIVYVYRLAVPEIHVCPAVGTCGGSFCSTYLPHDTQNTEVVWRDIKQMNQNEMHKNAKIHVHGGDVSSRLYATHPPPPRRSGPKAPRGGGGGVGTRPRGGGQWRGVQRGVMGGGGVQVGRFGVVG